MEIRGIDVSAWQGKIDWKTVADYGMGFAILRITEAGNVIDSYFEQNFSECRKYNISVGAYKYSYAMTVAEIQSEARKVVEVLNGRKLQYPVWLDLEWNNQRSLGAEQIHKLAEAFEKIITAAGYKFGIYCNVDWYLNVICSHLKKYDFWIARYPASDNGTLQERLRPDFGVGWQYSSKAKIPGISGTVDRNIFTVGAYDMINNSMWPPSSRGPNIRNIQKPNIVAPGVNIISAYPHNRYGNITGSECVCGGMCEGTGGKTIAVSHKKNTRRGLFRAVLYL